MREAILYEKLPGSRVRCHICQWRCIIGPGKFGVCRMRQNDGGTIFTLNYGLASSIAADPIEKKPLYHFFPGTLCFSLGTWGCNFRCKHCQNWQISFGTPELAERASQYIPPELAISLTRQYGCDSISWTYNEPTVWFEYTLDSAKLAKEAGLYTVYVTNGFLTPEALDAIGPYLDAFRVDVKGFTNVFYRDLAKVHRWREILEIARRAQERWDMHVEVITNVIPTLNDDEAQLSAIAIWVRDHLGELTPWHITRFYPHHQLRHLPPTPIATLEWAYEIGKRAGLRFVYLGNVVGHSGENTFCYRCGNLAVRRVGYDTYPIGLEGSRCRFCRTDLNFKTPTWQRSPALQQAQDAALQHPCQGQGQDSALRHPSRREGQDGALTA